jgi:hypothetical protein
VDHFEFDEMQMRFSGDSDALLMGCKMRMHSNAHSINDYLSPTTQIELEIVVLALD